jgi:flagellar hook protein FlgE
MIGTALAMERAGYGDRRNFACLRSCAAGDKTMGIFDALTTAVTGLRAQSFALENVSGNIANSQTTAFKRTDTSFEDLIPDNIPTQQLAGSVTAMSRSTITTQGNIQSASSGTFMAINGDGFFVVEKPSSFVDGRPVFDGTDLYTRRGDFQPNKDGYLVNGAGYYLMGIPIDSTTGNLSGSAPTLLQFQNDFLPAQATTQINYRANLASYPLTPGHDTSVPGSELLNPIDFTADPTAIPPQSARIVGAGGALLPDAAAVVTGNIALPGAMVNAGTVTINGQNVNITAGMTPAQVFAAINTAAPPGVVASLNGTNNLVLTSANADTAIAVTGVATSLFTELGLSVGTTNPTNLLTQNAVAQGQTMNITAGGATLPIVFGSAGGQVSTLAELNTALATLAGGTASVNTSNGNISIVASGASNITVTGTANALTFGMHTTSAIASNQVVVGNDVDTFIKDTVSGGAVTGYDITGSPVNLQLRWAKIDSSTLGAGHTDTWNLFYQTSSTATLNTPAWTNSGVNFTFGANGQLNPAVPNLTLNGVTVDGVSLGNVSIAIGTGGLTEFSDPNGGAQVNLLTQNGFAAGSLQTVEVNSKGRIEGAYSNGRTLDLAEVTLANFNGANFLKRLDGGAYSTTDESGAATFNASGTIAASSLEGSNTDIADEFTKLIVTQQAYSANTRVITTANQMMQDLLNSLR